MKINPVYKREITLSSRSMRIPVMILLFNALLTFVAILNMFMMQEQVKFSNEVQYSAFLQMYVLVASIEFALVILIIPALTAGSISGERERQTLDLMLTTKMKPWEIVFGKLISSFETIFILIISSFPVLSLVFIYGGIKMYDLIVLLLQFYLAGVVIGTFSIWFSSICKRTAFATVASYLALAVLGGGTIGINYLAYYIQSVRYMDYNMLGIDYGVGGLIYLMLVNPVVSFFELINKQARDQNAILKLCNQFGTYESNFIIEHWLLISNMIQLALAALFFVLAVRAVDPLNKKSDTRKIR